MDLMKFAQWPRRADTFLFKQKLKHCQAEKFVPISETGDPALADWLA